MILTLAQSPETLSADVCIIGAGAAGITVARKLMQHSLRVILCEAGDLDFDDQSQSNYRGRVEGDAYYDLDISRLRYFGGSTNHWTGWCRPLDSYDFTAKNGNPLTAWPIGIDAVQPYMGETRNILEVKAAENDQELGASGLKRVIFNFSPPVRFGEKYQVEFEKQNNAQALLTANLVGAELDGRRITAARVRDYQGNERLVRARYFVLACGGIENSRLLLWLQRTGQLPATVQTRQIGRYWMEHPHAPVGDVVITAPQSFKFNEFALDFFAPTPAFMESHGTLNCQLYLKTTDYGGAKEVIADLLCNTSVLGEWMIQKLGENLACVARLKAAWEQDPVRANRIALGDERDAFGIPRAVLHWTRNDQDMRTVRETVLAFAKYCARADIARVRLADWLTKSGNELPDFDVMGGYHHMGGTRMAVSPETGVVDADCRLFGCDNLYLAGSSVFPSVGHANPTFTIIQLSLRLADHLRAQAAANGA